MFTRQRGLGLPVLLEDRLHLAHHRFVSDPQPGFVDMFQGAPVKILTADKRLLAIHQQVLGVDDAAAQLPVGQHAQGQVGNGAQAFQGGGIRQLDAFFFEQETNLHAAFAGGFQVFQHRVHHRAKVVRGVELADINAAFGAVEQLDPYRAGLAQIVGAQGGVHRHGMHQFKTWNGKVRLGQRTEEQAGQAGDTQLYRKGHKRLIAPEEKASAQGARPAGQAVRLCSGVGTR